MPRGCRRWRAHCNAQRTPALALPAPASRRHKCRPTHHHPQGQIWAQARDPAGCQRTRCWLPEYLRNTSPGGRSPPWKYPRRRRDRGTDLSLNGADLSPRTLRQHRPSERAWRWFLFTRYALLCPVFQSMLLELLRSTGSMYM